MTASNTHDYRSSVSSPHQCRTTISKLTSDATGAPTSKTIVAAEPNVQHCVYAYVFSNTNATDAVVTLEDTTGGTLAEFSVPGLSTIRGVFNSDTGPLCIAHTNEALSIGVSAGVVESQVIVKSFTNYTL